MASVIDVAGYVTMTAMSREIKTPNTALQEMIFGRREELDTEAIEIDVIKDGRTMAPLTLRDSEAAMMPGIGFEKRIVEGPNIKVKRPFRPSELLFKRGPGTVVFESGGNIRRAALAHIRRDLESIRRKIDNRVEWMCAQAAFQASITYSTGEPDGATYYVDFKRPGAHDYTPAADWDDGTSDDIEGDVLGIKRLMAEEGLQPTDCFMDAEAADVWRQNEKVRAVLNTSNGIDAGSMQLQRNFDRRGMIYLGRIYGIRWWEYSRSANDLDGNPVPLIRQGYAEFVDASAANDALIYYAPIPDVAMLNGRSMRTSFFSKSWVEEDPPALMALMWTRPLPVPRRPAFSVSVDVVA